MVVRVHGVHVAPVRFRAFRHKFFNKMDEQYILNRILELEKPRRRALSLKYPFLKKILISRRIALTKIKNILFYNIAQKRSSTFFENVIARHQSVLRRTLGDSDIRLQEAKIINLKKACLSLNGLIIKPNQTFSLWESIGRPSYRKGYVDGMLLSNGKVIEGVGGGLCQLSNFLCWLFLHADTKVVERYHHSMDVFPDSGRVLPFGSGATCLFNFVDLKVCNLSGSPIQIKIWLTDNHLKGQLLSLKKSEVKYSVVETFHVIAKYNDKYYRVNEISRKKILDGREVDLEKVFVNIAPILYKIPKEYFTQNNYSLIDFDKK